VTSGGFSRMALTARAPSSASHSTCQPVSSRLRAYSATSTAFQWIRNILPAIVHSPHPRHHQQHTWARGRLPTLPRRPNLHRPAHRPLIQLRDNLLIEIGRPAGLELFLRLLPLHLPRIRLLRYLPVDPRNPP